MSKHRAELVDEPLSAADPWWNNVCLSLLIYAGLVALSDIAAAIREHTDVVLTAVAAATPSPLTKE